MNETICKDCGWRYEDPNPKGMGIHRPPVRCLKCDGRMLTRPIVPESISKFACGLQLEDEDDA